MITAPKIRIDLRACSISILETSKVWPLGTYQFIEVPVGSGALGKNWKTQATERKARAITLTMLPAPPRLN